MWRPTAKLSLMRDMLDQSKGCLELALKPGHIGVGRGHKPRKERLAPSFKVSSGPTVGVAEAACEDECRSITYTTISMDVPRLVGGWSE